MTAPYEKDDNELGASAGYK